MIWRKSEPMAVKAMPRDAKRVLIIQLGEIGEFVRALGAAKAIREFHVGARITLLATEAVKALAEKCPYFDTVEADGKPKEPPAITQLIGRIRTAKYDVVYDLEGSSRTNSYFQGMRPWPPLWSGPSANASHSSADSSRERMHPLDAYARQLELAGVPLEDQELLPDLRWIRAALRDPPRLRPDYFGIRGSFVLMLPRGDATARDRRWPEAKYMELASRLARQGVTPVVLGGPEERDVGASIARGEPSAKNLVTRADLFQAAGLAERASYVLGDDVDLMHVAAAAGAQCLTFLPMAATERAAPRGPGGVVSFTASVVADLPVEQVERQLRNAGVIQPQRATA
jgi:ADP-heptose:LPS heptosyltransferase